ncbi:MAG: putative Ig domain-containing protein [Leptospiraceae bacterium]|nr:putative Ig domain-containing protein [Leptospiraceae bacterium]
MGGSGTTDSSIPVVNNPAVNIPTVTNSEATTPTPATPQNTNPPSVLSYPAPEGNFSLAVGNALTPITPTVTGIVSSWTISPSLPTGLTFDSVTGTISGTPLGVFPTTTFTVTATNQYGNTNFTFTLSCNSPPSISYTLANGGFTWSVGTPITTIVPSTSGVITNWNVSPTLPAGLTFDFATGSISGTPSQGIPTSSYVISASNQYGTTNFPFTITVNTPPSNSKDITSFEIVSPSSTGVISGTSIGITVPFGTDVSNLIAKFTHTGANIKVGANTQVSETTSNNFATPKTYTVTAQDGGTKNYTITVTVALASSKDLTSFSFVSPAVTGVITGTNISVTMPFGTSINALVANFSHTGTTVKIGTTVQTSSTTTNNFTTAKVYSVFAQDGSKKDYTVTVSIALSPLKDMTAFGFSTPNVSGTINGANIKVKVPFGTNLTNLKAVFTHSGASVNITGINQVSGTTGNNFTTSKTYTVVAADGTSKNYTVAVTIAQKFTSFSLVSPNVTGTIRTSDVLIVVPIKTEVSALTMNFTHNGTGVKIGSTPQVSGVTVNDFTLPKTYTITAADGSEENFIVRISRMFSDTNQTKCYNNTSEITCGNSDFPRQDGDIVGLPMDLEPIEHPLYPNYLYPNAFAVELKDRNTNLSWVAGETLDNTFPSIDNLLFAASNRLNTAYTESLPTFSYGNYRLAVLKELLLLGNYGNIYWVLNLEQISKSEYAPFGSTQSLRPSIQQDCFMTPRPMFANAATSSLLQHVITKLDYSVDKIAYSINLNLWNRISILIFLQLQVRQAASPR